MLFRFRFTIREQSKENGLMSELGISPVYRHDTGFFKCSGSNYYGQDENSVELIVQGIIFYDRFENRITRIVSSDQRPVPEENSRTGTGIGAF